MLLRPAIALGCLCFVLVGCPVGIWLSRSDYLSAFITCFLPIVFLYYPMLLCGTNFAKSGTLPTAAAIFLFADREFVLQLGEAAARHVLQLSRNVEEHLSLVIGNANCPHACM